MLFGESLSNYVRFAPALVAGVALALVLPISAAHATSYTFSPFNVAATGTDQAVLLTGAPAGTVFTQYTVSFAWAPTNSSINWSSDAIWAFGATAPPYTTSTLLYADPGSAPNSSDNNTPKTLSWSGFMDTNYVGGNPLYFWYSDYYSGTSASWSNVSITLDTGAPTPPPSTSFTLPGLNGSSSLNSSLAAASINWYSFTYTGGDLTFDTLGSTISSSDTELALYNAAGGVVVTNDDIDFTGGNYFSRITASQSTLTLGNTYYIAAGAYDSTFGAGFGATSTSTATGNLRINVTVVPEAGTAGLLGFGGFFGAGIAAVARRRKSA